MTDKTKKIIKKEAITFLGIVFGGLMLLFVFAFLSAFILGSALGHVALIFLLFYAWMAAYPAYCVFRLIFWGIRTLQKKQHARKQYSKFKEKRKF